MSDNLLTARAVAEQLDVTVTTILRWTRAGTLPGIRLPGGALRYRESAIEAWIEERATPQGEGASPTPGAARALA